MRIVADDELAGAHETVVGHHLVRDARLGIVEAADAQPLHFPADERVFVGLLLRERRLVVIEQHEDAVAVPHARQAVLETRLQREIVHRLVRVVVHHRAVDARFEDVAGEHCFPRQVVPREKFLRDRLLAIRPRK